MILSSIYGVSAFMQGCPKGFPLDLKRTNAAGQDASASCVLQTTCFALSI